MGWDDAGDGGDRSSGLAIVARGRECCGIANDVGRLDIAGGGIGVRDWIHPVEEISLHRGHVCCTGWQIGAAGIFNATLAFATGGWHRAVWTWPGFGAIVYLSIFGSIFGLVAFTYLLQNVAVTKVSTYAFVNPVIAVLLGVMLLHERLVGTEIAGMAVIVCAVAMVVYSRVDRGKREIVGMAGDAVE